MLDWNPKFGLSAAEIPCNSVSAGELAADADCGPKFGGLAGFPPTIPSKSAFRSARIRAFREAISHGDFETSERIRGTVDRLLTLLNQGKIVF
jgi:hypothetical protein